MTTPPPDPGPPAQSEPPAEPSHPAPPPHAGGPPPPHAGGPPPAGAPGYPPAGPSGYPPAGVSGYPPAGAPGSPHVGGYGEPAAAYWSAGPEDPLVNPPHADFGGWWARVVALWRGTVGRLLAVAAITQLLPLVVFGAIGMAVAWPVLDDLSRSWGEFTRTGGGDVDFGRLLPDLVPVFVVGGIAGLVMFLLSGICTGASARLVVGHAAGQRWGVGDALRYGVRRMWGVAGWTLVVALINIGFTLLCLVPVLYSTFATSLVMMVYLCERRSPVGRSWKLTHARFGDVLGRLAVVVAVVLAASAVAGIIGAVLGLPFQMSAGDVDGTALLGQGVITLVQQVLSLPVGTFVAVAVAAVYAEARGAEAPTTAGSLAAEMDR